jgi:hypothetical protein
MTAEITRLRPAPARRLANPDQRPGPLTTAEDDVSGYPGFILDVGRLLASELVALATPEEGWAALMLWCRAWQQNPAGSLPDDERILASFSGAGARWPEVRDMALRGFIKCADGRLYHPILCADAKRASAKRRAWRTRREEAECHSVRSAAPTKLHRKTSKT